MLGAKAQIAPPKIANPGKRNHSVADAEYVECRPHRNLHQREAPMKDAAKQSQSGRAGIHFFSDAVDGNGGNGPKCLTDCNRKGQHRQLHDLGWIRHCEAVELSLASQKVFNSSEWMTGCDYVGSIYRAIWQIECDRNKHRLFVVGLDWRQKR